MKSLKGLVLVSIFAFGFAACSDDTCINCSCPGGVPDTELCEEDLPSGFGSLSDWEASFEAVGCTCE